jgi:hypothetical protein
LAPVERSKRDVSKSRATIEIGSFKSLREWAIERRRQEDD